MTHKKRARRATFRTLSKAATGIQGLDEITGGGLPSGRPTLVSGGAGSGKTLFGLEFLVRGATQFGEPGVFMSFEETIGDLTKNAASLGFDLARLVADKKLFVDHVSITRSETARDRGVRPRWSLHSNCRRRPEGWREAHRPRHA